MFLAQHIVIDVVCRGHFEASRAKLHIYVFIFYHRYFTPHQRHDDMLATQVCFCRVIGIDAHRRVTHDGLGAGGSHDGIVVAPCHAVFQIVELAVLLLVDYLLIAQSGQCLRVPIDHPHAAIYESLAIEVYEDFDDALAALLIHGECRAVPITRSPQTAQLFEDYPSVFVGPLPGMSEEFVTCQFRLLDALLCQTCHDFGLGGY